MQVHVDASAIDSNALFCDDENAHAVDIYFLDISRDR